ncbi:MAG: hypothetical protein P8130_00330 [Deltaproteobacteria bacterium]
MKSSRLLFSLLLLLILICGLVLAAPSLLSTNFGTSLLVNSINKRIPGSVGVESMSLSWFGGQQLSGITLKGPADETVLRLKRFATDASLLSLARGRLSLGPTVISGLRADIEIGPDGVSNLEKSLLTSRAAPSPTPPKPPIGKTGVMLPVPLTGDIVLEDSSVTLSGQGFEPVALADMRGAVHFENGNKPISAEFKAQAVQGKLKGIIAVEASVTGFDNRGAFDLARADGKMTVRLTDLPVDGIDQLLRQDGRLRAAVGNRLDLAADLTLTKGNAAISVKTSAPRLSADLSATVADHLFRLDRPARLNAVLTSDLLETLTREGTPLRLSANVPVAIQVDTLTSPVSGFQPNATAIKAELTVGDGMIRGKGAMDGLGWSQVAMSVRSDKLAEAVHFKLDGAAEQQGRKGNFHVDASLTNLFDDQGRLQAGKLSADAVVAMKALPVAMLDGLLGQKGLLVAALGTSINLEATCKGTGAGTLAANIEVKSDRLEATVPVQITNRIELQQPARVNFTVAPALVGRFVDPATLGLEKALPLTLSVSHLSAPRPAAGQPAFQPEDTTLTAEIELGDAALQSKTLGTFLLKNTAMHVKGENLAKLDLRGDLVVAPEKGLLRDALGQDLSLTLQASAGIGANGKMQLPACSLTGGGTALKKIFLKGSATKDLATFSLSGPATVDYSLPRQLVARITPKEGMITGLKGPADMQLTVERLTAPMSPFSLAATDIALRLTLKKVDFSAREPISSLSVSQTTVALAASGTDNKATFQVKGKTRFGKTGKEGSLLVDGTIRRFNNKGALDLAGAEYESTVELKKVPVALAEIAGDSRGLLPALLGDTLALDGRIKMTGFTKPEGNAVLKADSERMTLKADVALGKTVTFNVPAELTLQLTPEAFSKLLISGEKTKSKPGYGLRKTATLSAKVTKLTLPLPAKAKDKSSRMGDTSLEAEMTVRDLFLTDQSRTAGFDLLQASLTSGKLSSGVDFTLTGETGSTDSAGPKKAGKLNVAGRLTNLVNTSGSLAPAAMSASLKTDGSNLPVSLVDIVTGSKGKLTSILGTSMQITSNIDTDLAHKSTRFNLSEHTDHSSAEVKAMTEKGYLKLAKDMTADLEVTPALGKIVLAKLNPLLGSAVSADKPITLRVKKEKFQIPVHPFAVKGILVDQARVECGTIILENGGILQGLLALLRVGAGDRLTAQVTPIAARMENGIATYDRADIILDNRNRIASWGKVDVANDRVDMVLGLPAETLDKVFNVGGLSPDYVLQIPVRGTTANPKADWGRAGREIAALVARKQLGSQGPAGRLLEGLLGGSSKPAPPAPPAPGQETQQPQTGTQPAQPPAPTPDGQKQPTQQEEPLQQLLHKLIR